MRAPTRVLVFFLATASLAFGAVACEDMNRPFGTPRSPGPKTSTQSDGGAEGGEREGGLPFPAPSVTAQPGDIQI